MMAMLRMCSRGSMTQLSYEGARYNGAIEGNQGSRASDFGPGTSPAGARLRGQSSSPVNDANRLSGGAQHDLFALAHRIAAALEEHRAREPPAHARGRPVVHARPPAPEPHLRLAAPGIAAQ